ncbi:hypothetical protein BC941DRAFT_413039 [Chlamydoabsidia padenii]|nr:hypothetical protein BC941DRAFT_413039 [Chlamydoabsidia padenii]
MFVHCALYNDPKYPALYHRCILMDIVWLSGILICFLWLMLFCVLCFSTSNSPSSFSSSIRSTAQSSIQFYKYYLSDTHCKLDRPSHTLDNSKGNDNDDVKNATTMQQLDPSFTYAPTKSLPFLDPRLSEETLYNNISTKDYDLDALLLVKPPQPQEEKIQVSDEWLKTTTFQGFAPNDNNTIDNSNNARMRSMDMGRIQHNNDNGSCNSRRIMIARSCPGIKKERTTLTKWKHTTDNTLLRY